MMNITADSARFSARRAVALAATLACLHIGSVVQAQTLGGATQRLTPLVAPIDAPQIFRSERYAAGAAVGRVVVEVARNGIPADGQTGTAVMVQLLGRDNQLVRAATMVTIEVSGGRIQLPGASTDELGPGFKDADPLTPGTQVLVDNGKLDFSLLAPANPMDVVMRVTAGAAEAAGVITFVPELREMLAVGLVEGVIRLNRRDPTLIQPVRLDDGFDAELRKFSRNFSNGKGDAAARAAFYLKGKIRGDALLTASYDSEKDTRGRLLRDIKPDEFYPVYGDSAIRFFDAQSSSKLYVRVDKDRSYVLYGDFATADGFSQAYGGSGFVAPPQLRSLGAYSRTLTGVRGQWSPGSASEDKAAAIGPRGPAVFGRLPGGVSVGGFAAYDNLKQVTEEFRATGTSGPFTLRNNSALENSEKVELIVRDKDSPAFIKASRILLRLEDYTFEPFTGRVLLTRPLASVDIEGDPQSLRITYEVDQGGDKFWIGGVEASVNLSENLRLGGALIEDRNPVSPYRLGSVHAGAQLAERTWLTAEFAQSEAVLYGVPTVGGSLLFSNPTQQLGEQRLDREGRAARIALQHSGEAISLQGSVARTGAGFYNPSSGLTGGRRDANVRGGLKLTDTIRLFGDAVYSDDTVSGGERRGAVAGIGVQLTEALNVQAGVRAARENAAWNNSIYSITPNPTLGSPSQPTGGFLGGIDPTAVDPVTGQSIGSFAPVGSTGIAGQGLSIDANTVFLGARFQATERVALQGLVEGSVSGDDKHRLMLAGAYQLGERSRLVARYERQSGVTSAYGAAKSDIFSLGADTNYMPGGQLFSELRLRDAVEREAQWANGVRNTWMLSPGLMLGTGAEYLRVVNGVGGDAAALTLALDYTADPNWKFAGRLEGRRVFDADRTPTANEQSDSILATATVARKLDRDWTALARNYLLTTSYAERAGIVGSSGYDALQNRFQLGLAYRPVDTNWLDVLSKIEHKYSENASDRPGVTEQAAIASVHAIYHPSRPWWVSGRLAGKAAREEGISAFGPTRYNAALASGRLVYDVTENIDLGVMGAMLYGSGGSRQQAIGFEAGYLLQQNLWLSVGFNARGFYERDLSASEYTNRGLYLRLRFKFDEDLFAGTQRSVNRSLDRSALGVD